jgi:hypothetical protein
VLLDFHAFVRGSGADDRASHSVPEPAGAAMLVVGCGVLAALSRRKQARRSRSPEHGVCGSHRAPHSPGATGSRICTDAGSIRWVAR